MKPIILLQVEWYTDVARVEVVEDINQLSVQLITLLQVEWYKDGARVEVPHNNIKLMDNTQTLTIGVVVEDIDEGLYRQKLVCVFLSRILQISNNILLIF